VRENSPRNESEASRSIAGTHCYKGMEMLVLSRKKNESIVINNDITIVVVEIRGDKVRLGVEAPKEVPVHRRESTTRSSETSSLSKKATRHVRRNRRARTSPAADSCCVPRHRMPAFDNPPVDSFFPFETTYSRCV